MEKKFIIFIIASVAILFIGNFFTAKNVKDPKKTQKIESSIQKPDQPIKNQATTNSESISKPVPESFSVFSKVVANEKVEISGNNRGLIDTIIVKGFDNEKKDINLIWNQSDPKYFNLEFDLNGNKIDSGNFQWDIQSGQDYLKFSTKNSGIDLIKTIKLSENDYKATISVEVINNSNQPISLTNELINWGPSHPSGNEILQAVVFNQGKTLRYKPKKSFVRESFEISKGWIGVRNHYFCSIFYSEQDTVTKAIITQFADQTLGLQIQPPEMQLAPAQASVFTYQAYFGPQDYQNLKKIDNKLEKIVDFGMFHLIGVWMLYVLKYFYLLTKNYGVSIILLTVLIRALLWWPTHKSYTSMKKMQTAMNRMQPRLKTLKDLYKNDPQKLNEETMKLYKEYQINPMGGCLPMLLQMPVFFALYATLSGAVELKGANFIWIWTDLSLKDPMYILPIAMGISMFIQQKMSNAPAATPEAATQQKMMLYMMPIMLTVFSFAWPSGLLLYWVISNIISIAQQVIINRVEV